MEHLSRVRNSFTKCILYMDTRMVRKSENVYQYLWDSIRSSCAYLQLQLKRHIIHIDFEVAMHTVLKAAIPEATIKCCRFHLGQAG